MSTTHPINRTTEWDDLQIKYGNYAPLEKEATEEQKSRNAQNLLTSTFDPLAQKSLEKLDELDASGAAEEDLISKYRQQRLAELEQRRARSRFSGVYLVSMDNYVEQVTLGSSGQTTVVLHLYDDSVPECELMNIALEQLSARHPDVKFCKGRAANVLQKLGNARLPTVIIYQDKQCVKQLMGKSAFLDETGQISVSGLDELFGRKLGFWRASDDDDAGDNSEEKVGRLDRFLRASDQHTGANDKGYADLDLDKIMHLVRK